MPNGESTDGPSEREELPGANVGQPKVRNWVGVNIKFADGHYVANFNHGDPRIFHNMEQLLAAIGVEAGKLTVSG